MYVLVHVLLILNRCCFFVVQWESERYRENVLNTSGVHRWRPEHSEFRKPINEGCVCVCVLCVCVWCAMIHRTTAKEFWVCVVVGPNICRCSLVSLTRFIFALNLIFSSSRTSPFHKTIDTPNTKPNCTSWQLWNETKAIATAPAVHLIYVNNGNDDYDDRTQIWLLEFDARTNISTQSHFHSLTHTYTLSRIGLV